MEENLLHCAATLGMAAVPVVELRGAIPFGLAFGLPADLVFLLAVVGNMLPMPFLLFFVRKVFRLLRQRPWWGEKIDRLESRAHLKGRMVRKYRILGLIILVAIPLPGTGAWTGAGGDDLPHPHSESPARPADRRAHRRGHRDRRLLRRDLPLGLMDPPPRIDCTA